MTPAEAERVAEVLAATVNAVKMHVDSESAVVFVEEVAKGMARKTFPDFEWPALLQKASAHFQAIAEDVKKQS